MIPEPKLTNNTDIWRRYSFLVDLPGSVYPVFDSVLLHMRRHMFVYFWLVLLELPEHRRIFLIWVEAYKVYLQKNRHILNIIHQIR